MYELLNSAMLTVLCHGLGLYLGYVKPPSDNVLVKTGLYKRASFPSVGCFSFRFAGIAVCIIGFNAVVPE